NRFRQVLNLERDVRNRLDQFWIRGIVFEAHPFDAIGILPVTADVHLQMAEMNLILQRFGGWYAKVVVFHGGAQIWFLPPNDPDHLPGPPEGATNSQKATPWAGSGAASGSVPLSGTRYYRLSTPLDNRSR